MPTVALTKQTKTQRNLNDKCADEERKLMGVKPPRPRADQDAASVLDSLVELCLAQLRAVTAAGGSYKGKTRTAVKVKRTRHMVTKRTKLVQTFGRNPRME
jgi:hypothetical protein